MLTRYKACLLFSVFVFVCPQISKCNEDADLKKIDSLLHTHQYQEAIQKYKGILHKHSSADKDTYPILVETIYRIVNCYVELGQYDNATAFLESSLKNLKYYPKDLVQKHVEEFKKGIPELKALSEEKNKIIQVVQNFQKHLESKNSKALENYFTSEAISKLYPMVKEYIKSNSKQERRKVKNIYFLNITGQDAMIEGDLVVEIQGKESHRKIQYELRKIGNHWKINRF